MCRVLRRTSIEYKQTTKGRERGARGDATTWTRTEGTRTLGPLRPAEKSQRRSGARAPHQRLERSPVVANGALTHRETAMAEGGAAACGQLLPRRAPASLAKGVREARPGRSGGRRRRRLTARSEHAPTPLWGAVSTPPRPSGGQRARPHAPLGGKRHPDFRIPASRPRLLDGSQGACPFVPRFRFRPR